MKYGNTAVFKWVTIGSVMGGKKHGERRRYLKVQLSLQLVTNHVMKAYVGMEVGLHVFLNFILDRDNSFSHPGSFARGLRAAYGVGYKFSVRPNVVSKRQSSTYYLGDQAIA